MSITVAKEGFVATVQIDNPPNNHVSVGLMRELADRMEALDADEDVRATVLCSAGKNFCAGADFTAPRDGQLVVGDLYVEAVRLFSIKKPIIAAVQGAAVGAGLGLAVVADFRVADETTRFAANFTKLAFHPGFGLTYTLPRLIGNQKAHLMFMTGRRIKGDEAVEWGLADVMAPMGETYVEALKLAKEIAENGPLAIVSTRATMRAGLAEAVKAQTAHEQKEQTWLRATEDFAEGVRSVAERRAGNFKGK